MPSASRWCSSCGASCWSGRAPSTTRRSSSGRSARWPVSFPPCTPPRRPSSSSSTSWPRCSSRGGQRSTAPAAGRASTAPRSIARSATGARRPPSPRGVSTPRSRPGARSARVRTWRWPRWFPRGRSCWCRSTPAPSAWR